MAIQNQKSKWMTAKEVATMLRVHSYTVHDLLRTRRLTGFKLRKRWRIREDSVIKFINEREKEG